MPTTIYNKNYDAEVDLLDFSFTSKQGRGYVSRERDEAILSTSALVKAKRDHYHFLLLTLFNNRYRYYKGEPLFSFGSGLSYTTFSAKCDDAAVFDEDLQQLRISCKVANTGDRDGDEVLMLYSSVGDDIAAAAKHPVPKKKLVEFERVSLGVGEEKTVDFTIDAERLGLTTTAGDLTTYAGKYSLMVSNGNR